VTFTIVDEERLEDLRREVRADELGGPPSPIGRAVTFSVP